MRDAPPAGPNLALAADTVITPGEELHDSAVLVRNGVVDKIVAKGDVPATYDLEDLGNVTIAPGYVDSHIHGIAGYDTMDGMAESVHGIAAELLQYGVTAFSPSTSSHEIEHMAEVILACDYAAKRPRPGARILGMHVEGPFISPDYIGAQPADYVLPPSLEVARGLLDVAHNRIAIMTLAPELPGADEVIQYLVKHGVTVSAGHTAATYYQVLQAVDQGLRHATHTFNAMSQLTKREPGAVGAVLDSRRIMAELILDNVHVHPFMARLLLRYKGTEGIILVSDSTRATTLPDGFYVVAEQIVAVSGDVARLDDGRLAGSCITLDQGVRNAVESLGFGVRASIAMATANAVMPIQGAQALGKIAPGSPADIIVLDTRLVPIRTYVGGRLLYESVPART